MPKRSNDFQQLIYVIHHQLADGATVTESKLLRDRAAGIDREVDVVIESQVGDYAMIISVECQRRSRVADVEWVEQMAAKHQTLPTNKLILVSRSGFTPTARKKAASLGIETMTISQATQVDWAVLADKLDVLLVKWGIEPSACFAVLVHPTNRTTSIELDLDQQLYQRGDEVLTVRETIDLIVSDNPEYIVKQLGMPDTADQDTCAIFRLEFALPDNTYVLDELGAEREIAGLCVIGHAIQKAELIDLQHGSFGLAQVAYGKTRAVDAASLVSIVEHEDGPNTAAILFPSGDERHIIDLKAVEQDLKLSTRLE